MTKELGPLMEKGTSRLSGWEKEPQMLEFPYFPARADESPLFAHIIAFECVRGGVPIPVEVSNAMESYAKRGSNTIKIDIKRWNFCAMIGRGIRSDKFLKGFIENITYTFGEFSKSKHEIRSKLICNALQIESSVTSSASVN